MPLGTIGAGAHVLTAQVEAPVAAAERPKEGVGMKIFGVHTQAVGVAPAAAPRKGLFG